METVIDTLVVKVDADTSCLSRALATAQQDFEAVGDAADSSGQDLEDLREQGVEIGETFFEVFAGTIEEIRGTLEDFARTGELSFESLRRVALAALADIASAIFNGSGGGGGDGLLSGLVSGLFGGGSGGGGIFSSFFGLGGRALGGQVTTDRPFLVGERGPEIFFPRQAGRVEPISGQGRDAPVSITINMNGSENTPMSRESAGQIALQVRRAVERARRDQ